MNVKNLAIRYSQRRAEQLRKKCEMMEFTRDMPGKKSLKRILKEVKHSSAIVLPLTEKDLKKAFDEKRMLVMKVKGKVCGVVGYRVIENDWVEISPLIVLKNFRSRGYGKRLLERISEELQGKNLLVITSNPRVRKMVSSHNFTRMTMFRIPWFLYKDFFKKKLTWTNIISYIKKREGRFWDVSGYVRSRVY